ncbi:hypothetical protein KZY98_15855, partial [Croceibacter atlanticus]|uniref:hypothetical protein n=1 Tax=Croceibacter atlanticus TaxID=313588 RepID=UPI001C5F0FF5
MRWMVASMRASPQRPGKVAKPNARRLGGAFGAAGLGELRVGRGDDQAGGLGKGLGAAHAIE